MIAKQGRIRGNPVADGWAGAVMRKPLAIQKYFGRTDGPTETANVKYFFLVFLLENGSCKLKTFRCLDFFSGLCRPHQTEIP